MGLNYIKFLLLTYIIIINQSYAKTTINGAGATFPQQIYLKWAQRYAKFNSIQLKYLAVGSENGLQQLQAGIVDFAGSDKPLSTFELQRGGLSQFPILLGAIVPIINLTSFQTNELQLSGEVLADIYLGKIDNWSNQQIAKLNPDKKLPNQKIIVAHRQDGSGSTFLFTRYLTESNTDWAMRYGMDTMINWPVGNGCIGNDGLALYVQQHPGSIGYVEYNYAYTHNLKLIKLNNLAKKFLAISLESILSAASYANLNVPEDLINLPGANSWPIVGATFVLMKSHIRDVDVTKTKQILRFFDWAYNNGQKEALSLNFVPIPNSVVKQIFLKWENSFHDSDGRQIVKNSDTKTLVKSAW